MPVVEVPRGRLRAEVVDVPVIHPHQTPTPKAMQRALETASPPTHQDRNQRAPQLYRCASDLRLGMAEAGVCLACGLSFGRAGTSRIARVRRRLAATPVRAGWVAAWRQPTPCH